MKIAYITSLFPFAPEEQFFEPEVRELCREFDVLVVPVRPPSKTSAYPGLPAASLSQRLFGLEVALSAAREFLRAPVPAMIALAEVVFGRNSIRARVVNLACFPKALAVARHIRRRRIEHVHAAWLTTPATVAYVVWRLTGVEFSITAHAHDVFANNIIEKKVRSARFTRVISRRNCDALRTQLSQQAAERCVVGHLGVELPDAVPNHENPRPRILCPARLCTWKGHRYLLDALRILSDRGHAFSCDFAGGGELHDEIGS
jgi:glycosyltransferase involved in cell wall biosynthesis